MKFNPKVLTPDPDPFWVRQLRQLDPNLRLVWGYERYLINRWIVERKIEPERYWAMYANVVENDRPRFIEQPIFNDDLATYDENGTLVKEVQVGTRQYDLCPPFEHLLTVETIDKQFRQFGEQDMLILRRSYAWNITHPYSRKEWELEEQRKKDQDAASKQREDDLFVVEAFDQARREAGVKVQVGASGGAD